MRARCRARDYQYKSSGFYGMDLAEDTVMVWWRSLRSRLIQPAPTAFDGSLGMHARKEYIGG